jgi:hypothetical protein
MFVIRSVYSIEERCRLYYFRNAKAGECLCGSAHPTTTVDGYGYIISTASRTKKSGALLCCRIACDELERDINGLLLKG